MYPRFCHLRYCGFRLVLLTNSLNRNPVITAGPLLYAAQNIIGKEMILESLRGLVPFMHTVCMYAFLERHDVYMPFSDGCCWHCCSLIFTVLVPHGSPANLFFFSESSACFCVIMGYCNRCGEISSSGKCRKCGGRPVGKSSGLDNPLARRNVKRTQHAPVNLASIMTSLEVDNSVLVADKWQNQWVHRKMLTCSSPLLTDSRLFKIRRKYSGTRRRFRTPREPQKKQQTRTQQDSISDVAECMRQLRQKAEIRYSVIFRGKCLLLSRLPYQAIQQRTLVSVNCLPDQKISTNLRHISI